MKRLHLSSTSTKFRHLYLNRLSLYALAKVLHPFRLILGIAFGVIVLSFVPVWGVHLALPLSAIGASVLIMFSGWDKKGWRWAALGSLLWAIEELIWSIVRLQNLGYTSLTDIFYFLGGTAWFFALLTMPDKRLPRRNLLFAAPVLGLILWLLFQNMTGLAFLFPFEDALLFFLALPLIESALKSRAHEGRILWGFGFYVRVLASALFGWLSPQLTIQEPFYFLFVLGYIFIGLGAWLELRNARGTLLPAAFTIVALEVVIGTILYLLYFSSGVHPMVFGGIALVLAYLLFFGVMILIITDNQRRLRAERRLKEYTSLLEHLVAFNPQIATSDARNPLFLENLLALIRPSFPHLQGLAVHADEVLSLGETNGYAFPLVADGAEIGHLYFKAPPRNSNLLDAVSPLLASHVQKTMAHFSTQKQALSDPLTGLLNRRGLELSSRDLLEKAQRDQVPVSLVILDLDYFKRVNDTYGHSIGDKVLQMLAQILQRNIRSNDLVVRWGGEEFLLLLYASSLSVSEDVVRRISSELREHLIPPVSWPLTLSAGIVGGTIPDSSNLVYWLNEADKALYRAKDNGRDRVEVISAA